MKKIVSMLFAAGMLLMGANAFAQSGLGVNLGFIGASDIQKAGGKTSDPYATQGFYVGASYDLEVISNLYITPGLEFRMLTAKESYPVLGEGTNTLMSAAVPVDFKYAIPIGSNFKVFPLINVTFNIGISNTYKIADSTYDYYAGKLSAGNASLSGLGQENRFDIAAGVGAGVDIFDKIRIKGGYNWGAINLVKDGDKDNSLFRNYFYVGVAYLF